MNKGRKIPVCEFSCSVNIRKVSELHTLRKGKEKGGVEESDVQEVFFLLVSDYIFVSEAEKYSDQYEKPYFYKNVPRF